MPMILPKGTGITVTLPPGALPPGPQHAQQPAQPQAQAQPQPPVTSPFKQAVPPDLVIMPHLDAPAQPEPGQGVSQ